MLHEQSMLGAGEMLHITASAALMRSSGSKRMSSRSSCSATLSPLGSTPVRSRSCNDPRRPDETTRRLYTE